MKKYKYKADDTKTQLAIANELNRIAELLKLFLWLESIKPGIYSTIQKEHLDQMLLKL